MTTLRKTKPRFVAQIAGWLLLFVLGSGLVGCSNNIYDETVEIADHQWLDSDSIVFDFDIVDTSQQYNIFLEVAHETSYNYQNIYCLVETYGPNGLVQKQVSSLDLATKKGEWLGECSGEVCTRNIPFIINTVFDVAGTYKIVLKQHSRDHSLQPIHSLRLAVAPVAAS